MFLGTISCGLPQNKISELFQERRVRRNSPFAAPPYRVRSQYGRICQIGYFFF